MTALLAGVLLFLPLGAMAAGFSISGGTITLNNSAQLSTTADVVLNKGSLAAAASKIILGGNWNANGGSFSPGTSTVTFGGASTSTSTITGSTTFYTFQCVTPGKGMNFQANSTQTVTNAFLLTGASGSLVKLRSSISGTQWYLNNVTTNTVSYANPQDSNANAGKTIVAGTTSVDSGNNINWTFGTTTLGISVNPSTYDFGALPVNISSNSVSAISVTNGGNVHEDFSLQASSSTDWALGVSTPTSTNTFAIMTAFNSTRVSTSTFVTSDILTSTSTVSSATQFAVPGGDQAGNNVLVNASESLWFRLDTPTETSAAGVETITITITASQSP